MKRWQKWALGITLPAMALGAVGYAKRTDLVLALAARQMSHDIAPNRPIPWQQGPDKAAQPIDQRPPNVVFILLDDLGINDLTVTGTGVAGGRVPTPNIDRLAASGAQFTQAYSGSATCAVSRAQIITGRYPTRTGFEYTPTPPRMGRIVKMVADDIRGDLPPVIYDADADANNPGFAGEGLPNSEVTIAELLKKRGYHTVQIGKWHLGNAKGFHPNDQGFDESLMMESGLHLPENDPNAVNAKIDFDPIDRFLWASMRFATSYNNGPWFAPGGYLADYWTDQSIKVIQANRNRPFFLYLGHWGVHTPLQATKADYQAVGDIKPHRLRVYAAMLRALDRSVGRIQGELDRLGLAKNTMIVLSSDNGGPGYIGLDGINAPYRGFKITFFEGGIRVPLFMAWPGHIKPGTKVAQPVHHIDLMPTMAAAAGAPLPQEVAIDGQDLLPAAERQARINRPNDALYWNSGYYQVIRAGDWKLQVNGKQGKAWLFDLKSDPTELRNLADAQPAKLAELKALLARHQQGRKPPLYRSTTDSAIMIDKTMAQHFRPGDEYVYWPN
ncbi:MAG: Arylsulfatase [Pseudomonadota bacterium]